MTKTIKKHALSLALALSSISGFAQTDLEMLTKLRSLYPATTFSDVVKAPVAGLWEIRMRNQVAYTDESGRYFLFGSVYDMKTQTDLTAAVRPEPKSAPTSKIVQFPSQFLNNAIKTVRGDGSRVIAVFSDPKCPYCKNFESEVAKLNNVTIYTFIYPILGEASKQLSVAVWCSQNRERAWSDLLINGKSPKMTACANPMNDNIVLGSRLGIQGTPSVIASDGRVFTGAAPVSRLESWLSEVPGAPQ
jgi:thiol:disulfide interchange protein DsbC